MVASLFRGIPQEKFGEIKNMFLRIREELGVPLEVINDGDVTALAGSMSIEENGVLGIALGSSEAAGYVNKEGHIMGWLNELAFAPIDYSPNAPDEEWSGDKGCGASYFSQQCVFRLAPKVGIEIPADVTDAEKLKFVQEKLEAGHEGALKIRRLAAAPSTNARPKPATSVVIRGVAAKESAPGLTEEAVGNRQ
jgi:hypothetical protein